MALTSGFRSFGSIVKFNMVRPRAYVRHFCSLVTPPQVISIDHSQTKDVEDQDKFGTIKLTVEERIAFNKFDFEPEDNDEHDRHEEIIADIYRPGQEDLLRKINRLIHVKKDLKSALNVLETEMKEECVKPQQAHYRILINGCSGVGHARKAFQMYEDMKKRKIKRHVGIYADLFHSCVNCPDQKFALSQATKLRKELAEDHFIPNKIVYHTMIQAFGRTGDIETAFELIDEMRENEIGVTHETFNFLLQSCITDKEHGFRHALLTWRTMRKKQIWPRITNYHLMLKAAQVCRLGDIKHTKDILIACLPVPQQKVLLEKERREKKNDGKKIMSLNGEGLDLVPEGSIPRELETSVEMPNLLAKRPTLPDNLVGLAPEDNPHTRLMLMGGMSGLLELMAKDKVRPDIKTFDHLLRVIPNTKESEEDLLLSMKTTGVKPDVSFCNKLILFRRKRGDLSAARNTVSWMMEMELQPDIMTYGALATCCQDNKTIFQFIRDFQGLELRLNTEIMTTLLTGAAKTLQPRAVQKLLQICVSENVVVNKRLINSVETFYQIYRKMLIQKERGLYVPDAVYFEIIKNNCSNWERFVSYYKQWLLEVKPDLNEDPTLQYKTIRDHKQEKEMESQKLHKNF